jgi:hypothetical protein
LNAVVDLLANFDRLADAQLSIKSRVKPAATAPAAGATPATPAKTDDKTSEKSSDTDSK